MFANRSKGKAVDDSELHEGLLDYQDRDHDGDEEDDENDDDWLRDIGTTRQARLKRRYDSWTPGTDGSLVGRSTRGPQRRGRSARRKKSAFRSCFSNRAVQGVGATVVGITLGLGAAHLLVKGLQASNSSPTATYPSDAVFEASSLVGQGSQTAAHIRTGDMAEVDNAMANSVGAFHTAASDLSASSTYTEGIPSATATPLYGMIAVTTTTDVSSRE